MISRYQRILFWVLLGAAVAMAAVLVRLRDRAADRLANRYASADSAPIDDSAIVPASASEEAVTLLEANDADGTLSPVTRNLALPKETGARARMLVRQLFADYAAPASKHPLPPGAGVEEVFFMPDVTATNQAPDPHSSTADEGQIAIVNLTGTLANNHPSGIEPETLTLLSIIGTLHETFPGIDQVRFLVDGQPRQTLAGHADLTRAYLTASSGLHP